MPRTAPTTCPGYTNANRQTVVGATGAPSTSFAGQSIYKMLCTLCENSYGSNGCDTHHRRCPACQNGGPGEPLRELTSLRLFDLLDA